MELRAGERGAGESALSVVVPAYDEAGRVGPTIRRIIEYLDRRGVTFELIVVDDGSRDGTGDAAQAAVAGDPRLRVVRLERNQGKGAAVRAGVRVARGETVLFSDADLSTPIEEIERLEEALASGADVGFGSRALRNSQVIVRQPLYRKTMGKIFNLLVQVLVLPGVRDSQCGFKLFRATAARAIFSRQRLDRFAFDVEALFIARRLGYRLAEVPVRWINSPASRVHPVFDSARMFLDLFRIRWFALRGAYGARTRVSG